MPTLSHSVFSCPFVLFWMGNRPWGLTPARLCGIARGMQKKKKTKKKNKNKKEKERESEGESGFQTHVVGVGSVGLMGHWFVDVLRHLGECV